MAMNLLDSKTYYYTMLKPLQFVYYEYGIRPLNALLGLEVKFLQETIVFLHILDFFCILHVKTYLP